MAGQAHSIKLANTEVIVRRTRLAKSIKLKVRIDGVATVSAPARASLKSITEFVMLNEDWLNERLEIVKNSLKKGEISEAFLGYEYRLIRLNTDKFKPIILSDVRPKSFIFSHSWLRASLKRQPKIGVIIFGDMRLLDRLKRGLARWIFGYFVLKYTILSGLKPKRISIKNMRTRWGSCNSRKGYINLSLELLKVGVAEVEYVVLHEMAHLLYPHHQSSFYGFIFRFMPDFKQRQNRLKQKSI